jgi:hypothetical protein
MIFFGSTLCLLKKHGCACLNLPGVIMSANSEKLIRKQFLVSPATARRLERLAAASGTSASEIVRQAINAFEVNVAKTLRLLDESA